MKQDIFFMPIFKLGQNPLNNGIAYLIICVHPGDMSCMVYGYPASWDKLDKNHNQMS